MRIWWTWLYERFGIGRNGMTVSGEFFPAAERVMYERSPLMSVICQVRYPSILRIDSDVPADFQDRVRDIFPLFERSSDALAQQIPAEVLRMLGNTGGPANYTFKTADGSSLITLSSDSMSVSTTAYDCWEEFAALFGPALVAFADIYKPAFYSRVGLRYLNLIRRSPLGLGDVPWRELIAPPILGELNSPFWEENAVDARRVIRCVSPDGENAFLLQHGFATEGDDPEQGYLIDFDFYTDNHAGAPDADAILGRFHERTGSAFHWCISEALHQAMGPSRLGGNG